MRVLRSAHAGLLKIWAVIAYTKMRYAAWAGFWAAWVVWVWTS